MKYVAEVPSDAKIREEASRNGAGFGAGGYLVFEKVSLVFQLVVQIHRNLAKSGFPL